MQKDAVVKDFLTTASDRKKYSVRYYNLDVIISVGYRVKSKRGVEFRRWANNMIAESRPTEKEMMVSVSMNCISL